MYKTRAFVVSDLNDVLTIETDAFGNNGYPAFLFVQFKDVMGDSFLVAEDVTGRVVGYAIGSISQGDRTLAWVLSLAVANTARRKGVGRQLMEALFRTLHSSGADHIRLTVNERNRFARNLYDVLGMREIARSSGYFARDKARMTLILECDLTAPKSNIESYDRALAMAEADVSMSLVNVLFGVGLAAIAISADKLATSSVAMFYLFLVVFSSLYSSLFYANATGVISRLSRQTSPKRSFEMGNAVSEYLGVFPLVLVFPVVVWTLTHDRPVTALGLAVDLGGLILYQSSGFDIVSRIAPRRFHRLAFIIAMSAIAVTTLWLETVPGHWGMALAIATTLMLSALCALHLRRSET